jgi:cytochrome c-type biogenesis protein
LLISYTAGYVAPVDFCGTFTAAIKKLLQLRQWSGWINPVSGALLVGLAVYFQFCLEFQSETFNLIK